MLIDAFRLYEANFSGFDTIKMVESILNQALIGLRLYSNTDPLNGAAHNRLAFRELGLAIGFRAIDLLSQMHNEGNQSNSSRNLSKQQFTDISLILEALKNYAHLAD